MHDDRLEIEVVQDSHRLVELQGDWDDLFRRAERPYLSQSFVWCWSVWENLQQPLGARLHCVVGRVAGRPVLIMPMIEKKFHFWTIAYFLGTKGDYSDILAEASNICYQFAVFAWRTFCAGCRADKVRVDHVRTGSLLYQVLAACSKRPARVEAVRYMAWSDNHDWERYWRSRGKSYRAHVDRRYRRLSELGDLSFTLLTDERYDEIVEWMIAHKQEWMTKKKKDCIFWLSSEDYKKFLFSARHRVRPFGEVAIFVLLMNGDPIAVQLNRVDPYRVECLHTSYDLKYGKYSPGNILAKHVLQWCLDRDLIFDYLFGDDEYKKILCDFTWNVVGFEKTLTVHGRSYDLLRSAVLSVRQVLQPLQGVVARW